VTGKRVALGVLAAACGGLVLWAALGGGGASAPVPPAPPGPAAAPGPSAAPETRPAEPGRLSFTHPSQCKQCHPEVWEEWAPSMHARATADPEARALSDNFKTAECVSCHAPQPIHSTPLGGRVFERSGRWETGVDCLSCHLLPDGGVAAARDVPGAPCAPRRTPTLREAITCKGCHEQHGLVSEWETLFSKPDPAKGALLAQGRPETCLDCHMKPVARPPGADGKPRTGVDHRSPGGHSVEMLRSGVTLDARIEGRTVVASITNSGVGHRAPADSRHRSFNVWITATTAGGVKVHDRVEVIECRMYYRTPPRENTNLRPGETATARLDLPEGIQGTVVVELVFALNPFKKERREVHAVHRLELPFDTSK
jgi:hypothetical protein